MYWNLAIRCLVYYYLHPNYWTTTYNFVSLSVSLSLFPPTSPIPSLLFPPPSFSRVVLNQIKRLCYYISLEVVVFPCLPLYLVPIRQTVVISVAFPSSLLFPPPPPPAPTTNTTTTTTSELWFHWIFKKRNSFNWFITDQNLQEKKTRKKKTFKKT